MTTKAIQPGIAKDANVQQLPRPESHLHGSWISFLAAACIVFGVAGAMRYLAVIAVDPWVFYGPVWPGMDQPPGAAQVDGAKDRLLGWAILSTTVAGGLGLMLLEFGLSLERRAHWAMRLGVVWSVLKILQAILAAVLSALLVHAQVSGIPDPSTPLYGPGWAGPIAAIGYVGVAIVLMWHVALPGIVLITAVACKSRLAGDVIVGRNVANGG